jgi:hypothetical protein
MTTRLRRGFMGAAAIVAITGCSAVVRHPAQAPMITLASPTLFRLHARDSAQSGCDVQRAQVQITAVRGDTLFFASATPQKWPYAAPRCAVTGPGFVRTGDHPDLQSERLHRSALLALVTVPIALLSSVTLLLILLLASG